MRGCRYVIHRRARLACSTKSPKVHILAQLPQSSLARLVSSPSGQYRRRAEGREERCCHKAAMLVS
jgi:hypothetical protein